MAGKFIILRKLLIKALLLFLPLYALWFVYIQYFPLYYSRPNGIRWYFIEKALEKEYPIPNSRVLFLGESRVNAGIDFNKIDGCYNFSAGGATSIEMYCILKRYSENYNPPDTVFLSISPRFFCETFAFFPHAVASKFIGREDFREISSNLSAGDTTLGRHPDLKFLLYQINYFEYYQSDVFYNYVINGRKANTLFINEILRNNGASPHPGLKDSCSDLNYETKYKSFAPSPLIDLYFDKILRFCKEKNIYLIFDFMPFNESSFKVMNKDFANEYKAYIKGYSKKYPDFQISDTMYSRPDIYFGDESHLNPKGKEQFTDYLLKKYFTKKDTVR